MKKIYVMAFAALCMAGIVSCDPESEPGFNPDMPSMTQGAFVLNQGNYYSGIEGSLTYMDYADSVSVQNVFQNANNRSIGATPQTAIIYGSKLYVGVYESNTIEVVDATTMKSLEQIQLANEKANGPRSFVAKDGKVYVSMYSGYVAKLDTVSLAIEDTVKVGPNPETMALYNGKLYVPNSDGMNWQNGYGRTASIIDLQSFSVEETIEVPLNPTQFVTNGTDLYLLCMGDYYMTAGAFYRVNADNRTDSIAPATLIAMKGSNVYFIDAPFMGTPKFGVYNIRTEEFTDMVADGGTDYPAGVAVDPVNGNIVITSYRGSQGYAAYNDPGYAKVYDAKGVLKSEYQVGVAPLCIFFNYK